MRSVRLPWGAPLSLVVWVALLLFTYPLGTLVARGGKGGGLNDRQFVRYQSAELQCRLGYGLGSPVDDPASTFAELAASGKLPGAARKALILRGRRASLEPELLAVLPEGERPLWRAVYAGQGAVPDDAEARIRGFKIGFLTERAVADAVGRRDGEAAGAAAIAAFEAQAQASINRLFLLLGGQFLVIMVGLGLLAWTLGVHLRRPPVAMGVLAGLVALAAVAGYGSLVRAGMSELALFGAILVLVLGMGLWIPGGIGAATRVHWLPRVGALAPTDDAGHWLDGFAFYMMSYRMAGLIAALVAPRSVPALGLSQFVSGGLAIAYVLWRARRRGAGLTAMGLRFRPADLLYGIVGFAQNFPLVVLLGMVASRLFAGATDTAPNPMMPLLTSSGGVDRLWLLAMAVVGAPVLEEFFFRGALYSALRARYGWIYSALGSSAVFAALHPIQDWLPILGLGLGFAWMRERRQSLTPGIVAHALQNGMASAMAALLGN